MQLSKVLFALLSLQSFLSVDSFIKKPLVPIRLIKKQITMNESPNSGNHDESDFPLTIKYYGDISTKNCLFLTESLKKMDYQSKIVELKYNFRPPIKLHFQSHGGELLPSFFVCDVIKNLDTPVHIYIDGYVASAASLIAVCGTERIMSKHSFMLIHQLKSNLSGKFNEMEDEIKNLNFFMNNLKEIYLNNSNITSDKLNKLLATDIWISAEQCLSLGLIDRIC